MKIVNVKSLGGKAGLQAIGGVYVGRPNPLGNPFVIPEHGDRDIVLQKYRRWLYQQILKGNKEVINALAELSKDSILGCWCAPLPCHAQVIEKCWNWWIKQ